MSEGTMTMATDPLLRAAVELTDRAGLELTDSQRDALAAILAIDVAGTWISPEVVSDAEVESKSDAVLHARALVGLLVLNERIVWTPRSRQTAALAFAHFVDLVNRIGVAYPDLADLKVCRRNGEEYVERTSTGARVRFTTHRSSARGWTYDVAIIQDAPYWTQRDDLLPCMASMRNPQIIRA